MADRRPKDLPATARVGSGSYILLDHEVDGTTKIDYDRLAKAIIENFTGSELAGSGQSLKSAIDALDAWTTSNSADDTLDTTSTHPVQNAPVATAIEATNTKMGTTDISGIGGGTVTGAISKLNTDFDGLFDESKATALSVYENRIDNNHLAYYYIGDLCFVYGLFRVIASSPWADMALATGLRTPAWNTMTPIHGVNNTTHDAVMLYVNAAGSLCLRTVIAQYTWVSVFGLYRSN